MNNFIKIFYFLLTISIFGCKDSPSYSIDKLSEGTSNHNNNVGTIIQEERKIIKEGYLKFETLDVNDTHKTIINKVNKINGYISSDRLINNEGTIENYIIIRVPANKFDSLLINISESVSKIDDKEVKILDITEEYIDAEARLVTKKELESTYKALLKRTNNIEEILKIEKEIGDLRSDIESIEGRIKYMTDRIAFSTLTINFYQKTALSFAFGSKFILAIYDGWSNLLCFIIGITHVWPFLIIIGLILFFIFRIAKKKKKTYNNP